MKLFGYKKRTGDYELIGITFCKYWIIFCLFNYCLQLDFSNNV